MESEEISQHDFPPFFRVQKDGSIHRYQHTDFLPPSLDPPTRVTSKDVTISQGGPELKARIYLPTLLPGPNNQPRKLPLLIYVHGGAFSIQSPFSSIYHNYLNRLVAEAEVVAVSVDYRLAPENPLPACYDDSCAVFKWVVSHARNASGPGRPEKPEVWLSDHADFTRVFLGGDSAGANIAHDLMVQASKGDKEEGVSSFKVEGMVLVHPFFGNGKEVDRLWEYIYPGTSGSDDPRLNPAAHGDVLSSLECRRVLVCVAEKDGLRKRGWSYYEALKRSGFKGELEIVETKGQSHVFHLLDPSCEDAGDFMKLVASFIKKTGLASL